jgi:hypothetical protein
MSAAKRIAIMQPYFLPYLGYWQLMNCVDTFVVYDDIQFTKKGWIHRNRFLQNGRDQMFSLPLKKDSDYLDVVQRTLADSWDTEKHKLLRRIAAAYQKAPNVAEGLSVLEQCLQYPDQNLFEFILHSISLLKDRLGIAAELVVSSQLGDTSHFKGQERVLEICRALSATDYINPIGGLDLYQPDVFARHGINLSFHRIGEVRYPQPQPEFLPNLSIVDMLMFVGVSGVKDELDNFEFVQ